jgi:predicted nucleotidyltransferase
MQSSEIPATPTAEPRIPIPREQIAEFCRRWKITEFALFGSVLRDDFRPDSDVDVLVTFAPEAGHSLFDFVTMEDELVEIFGRKVDLVEKEAVQNPFRRHHILRTQQLVYAS